MWLCVMSVRTLQKLHAARLKVSFGDEVIAEQEREIEILTQEITRVSSRTSHCQPAEPSHSRTAQLGLPLTAAVRVLLFWLCWPLSC